MSEEREANGKRASGVGRLRPNIVLYGEENPHGLDIRKVAEADLRKRPDLVLVVGTRLKVPGASTLVRELCSTAQKNGGLAVWVNKEPPRSSVMKFFNLIVLEDCDIVVRYGSI